MNSFIKNINKPAKDPLNKMIPLIKGKSIIPFSNSIKILSSE